MADRRQFTSGRRALCPFRLLGVRENGRRYAPDWQGEVVTAIYDEPDLMRGAAQNRPEWSPPPVPGLTRSGDIQLNDRISPFSRSHCASVVKPDIPIRTQHDESVVRTYSAGRLRF
jgi:hypothetical protein